MVLQVAQSDRVRGYGRAEEEQIVVDSVGFIGLGIMGAPMVRNLLSAGFEMTVCKRTRA